MTNKSNLKFVVRRLKISGASRCSQQEQVICAKLGGDGDLQSGELERGKKESTVKRVLTIHSILV